MATAPVKSQPLHYFSLPFLKWGQRNHHMNNNRSFRRPSDSTAPPPPPPISEPDSDTESEERNKLPVGSRTAARNRFPFSFCSSQRPFSGGGVGRETNEGDEVRKKRCDEAEAEAEVSVTKPWNLRPRKVVTKMATAAAAIGIGTASLKNASSGELQEVNPLINTIPPVENFPKSTRLRGYTDGHGCERRERRKFWISLSREEIEEDVYALTGSKPARRPKKRPRTVQKQVDNLLPGSYFAGVTIDSYRVYDALAS